MSTFKYNQRMYVLDSYWEMQVDKICKPRERHTEWKLYMKTTKLA